MTYKNFSRPHCSRGFSLVEVIIAAAMGLIGFIGLVTILTDMRRASATQDAVVRLQRDGDLALQAIARDLRSTGRMPCGSNLPMEVSVPEEVMRALGVHKQNGTARVPPDEPYNLGRSIFINGSSCAASPCPLPMHGDSSSVAPQRVLNADRVTLRYIDDSVPPFAAEAKCRNGSLYQLLLPGDTWNGATSVMLASCKRAQLFEIEVIGNVARPRSNSFRAPECDRDGPVSVYDLTRSLATVTYFVRDAPKGMPTLVRRENGVNTELTTGVKEFVLRYSLTDITGMHYWLTADELYPGTDAAQICESNSVPRPCGWEDIDAVDVSLVVARDWTVDGSGIGLGTSGGMRASPGEGRRVSSDGSSTPQLLIHEFHATVALRSFHT